MEHLLQVYLTALGLFLGAPNIRRPTYFEPRWVQPDKQTESDAIQTAQAGSINGSWGLIFLYWAA